jgi:hypothetical protein
MSRQARLYYTGHSVLCPYDGRFKIEEKEPVGRRRYDHLASAQLVESATPFRSFRIRFYAEDFS